MWWCLIWQTEIVVHLERLSFRPKSHFSRFKIKLAMVFQEHLIFIIFYRYSEKTTSRQNTIYFTALYKLQVRLARKLQVAVVAITLLSFRFHSFYFAIKSMTWQWTIMKEFPKTVFLIQHYGHVIQWVLD